MGRLTTSMPALATRSSVSSARASSWWRASSNGRRRRGGPKPVSSTFRDVAQRVRRWGPSSRRRGNRPPCAGRRAWAKKVELVAQVRDGVGDHAQHAALGSATRSAVWRSGRVDPSRLSQPIRHGGLQLDPAGPFLRSSRKTGQVMASCGGMRVEMRADRAGAVGVGGAQRELHARAQVLATSWPLLSRHGGERAHEGAVGLGLRGQICPCRDGCACRRRQGKTMAPAMSTAIAVRLGRAITPSAMVRSVRISPPSAPKGRRGR
jgi:hypothetical protein